MRIRQRGLAAANRKTASAEQSRQSRQRRPGAWGFLADGVLGRVMWLVSVLQLVGHGPRAEGFEQARVGRHERRRPRPAPSPGQVASSRGVRGTANVADRSCSGRICVACVDGSGELWFLLSSGKARPGTQAGIVTWKMGKGVQWWSAEEGAQLDPTVWCEVVHQRSYSRLPPQLQTFKLGLVKPPLLSVTPSCGLAWRVWRVWRVCVDCPCVSLTTCPLPGITMNGILSTASSAVQPSPAPAPDVLLTRRTS